MLANWDWTQLIAGLGLFLFGMYLLEDSLKNLSERKFKLFLRKHTETITGSILSGALVTAILQSSSLVSLMTIALVGAGITTFQGAMGIVWGANLGTTISGWLFTLIGFKLKLGSFASICIFLGALMSLIFSSSKKIVSIGRFLFAFGVLFLGLSFMKTSMMAVSQQVDLSDYANLNPYFFFPIGILLTAIVQSSSATMVLTLSAINSGIIGFPQALAIIIGADIGTTITIFIASFKGAPAKKRVAWSHLLFNCFNSLVFLTFLHPISAFCIKYLINGSKLYALVGMHTAMNLTGILCLSPFLRKIADFLEQKFPEKRSIYTYYVHQADFEYPEIAIDAVKKEARSLIESVINFGAKSFGEDKLPFPRPQAHDKLTSMSFHAQYNGLKHIKGEVLDFYLNFQKTLDDLEPHQQEFEPYVESVKKSLSSAKHLKDVNHNIVKFSNSGRERLYNLYVQMKENNITFYGQIIETLDRDEEVELGELFDKNQLENNLMVSQVYQLLEAHDIENIEATTLLLVLREIYSSNKGLILAMKDLKGIV